MRRTLLFFAVASAVPALFAACGGGRTEVSVADNEPVGSQSAGAGGRGGRGGGEGGRGGVSAGGSGPIGTAGSGPIATGGGGGSGPIGGTGGTGGTAGTNPGKGGTGGTAGTGGTGGTGGTPGKGGTGGTGGAGGSTPGKGGTGGSTPGKGGTGGSNTDPPIDIFDAGIPLPDSGPVGECVTCLEQNCKSSINGCINDSSCTGGIQCAVTTCLGGGGMPGGGGPGGLDFQCLLGCFDGDLGAVLTAVQAFQCVTGTCGEQCGGALGGIGGGGGPFGGLGGGGTPLGGGGMTPPNPGNAPTPQNVPPNIDGVRIPMPEEVPGFPAFQKALERPVRVNTGAPAAK